MISANPWAPDARGTGGGGPVRLSAGGVSDPERRVRSRVEGWPAMAAVQGRHEMTRYLISFDDGAMDHIPAEEIPDVGKAAHEVMQEAVNAGVWVFGGGLESQMASIAATDGT